MQPSTLTYSVNHTVLESRVKAQRPFPCRDLEILIIFSYKIKVEILNIYNNTRRALLKVGENPLNGSAVYLNHRFNQGW